MKQRLGTNSHFKRLTLNKVSISHLNFEELGGIRAGAVDKPGALITISANGIERAEDPHVCSPINNNYTIDCTKDSGSVKTALCARS